MAYETDNLRKLREECHIQWPLHVNPHNHFIEDRIGVVIASVAGGGERIAPYLAAAANVLPEALDEIERLRKALHLACTMIEHKIGLCPDYMYDGWEGCLKKKICRLEAAECWEKYFTEKTGRGK